MNATEVSAVTSPIEAGLNPRPARITEANGPSTAISAPLSTNSRRMRTIVGTSAGGRTSGQLRDQPKRSRSLGRMTRP